jgi:type I pantothenate kinase
VSAGISPVARDVVRRLAHAPADSVCVIAITGSVAVGKSVFSRALRRTLVRRLGEPVGIVSTDGFLRADADLERAGLLQRKGFPESYDHAGLARFFAALAAGDADVSFPVYCHRSRGVVEQRALGPVRWLIVEGVYSLQAARASGLPCCSIFLDADNEAIEAWYVARFLTVRSEPSVTPADLRARARQVFANVNRPNYLAHIAPLRSSADLVLRKALDHRFARAIA